MIRALKLLAIVALSGALFFSCKKKKSSASEEVIVTSVPTTSYTPFFFSGSFEHNLSKGDSISTSFYGTLGFANAGFFEAPYTGVGAINYIDGGSLSINGVSFVRQVGWGISYYSIPSATVPTNPSHWLSTGNGTVPAINFNDNTPWPTYTGKVVLPDTIVIAYNNIILIQGIGGADEIQINLASGTNWFQKIYPVNTNSVVVTPADLSVLQAWNPGFMQIIARKKIFRS